MQTHERTNERIAQSLSNQFSLSSVARFLVRYLYHYITLRWKAPKTYHNHLVVCLTNVESLAPTSTSKTYEPVHDDILGPKVALCPPTENSQTPPSTALTLPPKSNSATPKKSHYRRILTQVLHCTPEQTFPPQKQNRSRHRSLFIQFMYPPLRPA